MWEKPLPGLGQQHRGQSVQRAPHTVSTGRSAEKSENAEKSEKETLTQLPPEWVWDGGEARRQSFHFPLPKQPLLHGAVISTPPSGEAEQPLIGSQMEQWRWINVNWIFLTLNKICIGMKLINRELSEGSLAHQCVRRQWYPSGRWWEEAAREGIQLAANWN